jgi:hypothetical protein
MSATGKLICDFFHKPSPRLLFVKPFLHFARTAVAHLKGMANAKIKSMKRRKISVCRPKERLAQRKFAPAAMYFSLSMRNRWKTPAPGPKTNGGDHPRRRSTATLLLNKTNVKRKPAAPRRDNRPG